MRIFIETTFFNRLSNGFTEENIELKEAYNEFIYSLTSFCKNEQDLISASLTLSYTKSEFQSLDKSKCCPSYLYKSSYMIDAAINVLNLRIKHSKTLVPTQIKHSWKSPLCLSGNVDYVNIMELICGLFYTKTIQTISGATVNFTDVSRIFEIGLNFKFSDIHKKRDEVFVRKVSKRTEFLNRLIYAINIESKNRGYL